MEQIRTKRIAVAAYAAHVGGAIIEYERGDFIVMSPWPLSELLRRYAASPERNFDGELMRLRDIVRAANKKR